MSDENDLGDFEDFRGGSPESPDTPEDDDMAQHTDSEAFDPTDNPLGLDPVPGKADLCFDRAKPGAKVYVVGVLGESIEDYRQNFPDAPELDTFEGNVIVRMRPNDRVLACIYVDQSLTSTPETAYPMPESRLTRLPAETASLIGSKEVTFDRPPEGDTVDK